MTTGAGAPPRRAASYAERAYGAVLLGCGLVSIIAPLTAGGWAVGIVGLVVVVAGAVEILHAVRMRSCGGAPAGCRGARDAVR
jgi:uncharacterized membrane protein HdeD (DUF308 family)